MYAIEEFDKNKTKVLKYIIYKKRTENEIRRKFENDIEPNMLDDIIEYLKEAKYIDDKEYIERTINNFKLLKNLSIKELKYKLMAKGLDKDILENYFYEYKDELTEYEIKSAINLINKKSDMDTIEIKNFLLKKGYKMDNINIALNNE